MCGITGFLDLSRRTGSPELQAVVKRMADTLIHRGPDAGGVWEDATSGVALGHRRLSIIDLSTNGHQPMHSASGRYVITFNGEIYNFKEIRREIESTATQEIIKWRGHSDTEILLASVSLWGLEGAISRFNGMFAFALWDRQDKVLYLVRDRLGEKPLYYGWMGNTFLFGSELKSLCAHPDFKGEINRDALTLYLRHNYIPTPYSIYQNINKLPPGTVLTVNLSSRVSDRASPEPYWSVRNAAEEGISSPFNGTEDDAAAYMDELMRSAVRMQMEADVPLGAFLSGGIDSSAVVALMQAQSARPVKTFTIGFKEGTYNEAQHAKEVATHLGTEHTELYVTPEDAMSVIQRLPALYDEPFSDSSQIPTFLVSQMTRQHVTVSLSGDGGDELFGGYNRYFWGSSIWRRIGWMPKRFRQILSRGLTTLSPQTWDYAFGKLGPVLSGRAIQRNPGDKLHKLSEILTADSADEIYNRLISHWKSPSSIVVGSHEPLTVLTDRDQWAALPDITQRMMFLDTITYLPDDILVKVDRASMGVSLEARVPFLDHRVVEFAWKVPLSMKVRNGRSKWLLRRILYNYIPKELVERPKMGFGVPIDSWLRGPLKDWAESLLNEKRLRDDGFFNPEPISEKWKEHLSGHRNWQYHLWDILMFQSWLHATTR